MEMKQNDYELFQEFLKFKEMKELKGLAISPTSQSNKRKRREKGTGSIVNLGKTRARPFMASISIGYDDDNGNQKQKPLAYFHERKHANKALDIYLLEKDGKCTPGTLLEYIRSVEATLPRETINTVNLTLETNRTFASENKCPTFEEIWKKVLNSDLSHLTNRSLTNYRVSFNRFKNLHKRKINTLKLCDLQPHFDELMETKCSGSKMNNMKIVLNSIFKYAIKYDHIEKNYAEFIKFKETLDDDTKKKKTPYTKEEIKELFKYSDNDIVKSILVMIYTGMRPSELLKLDKDNIYIEEKYMIGGIKTDNGINRIIPIHECIVDFVKDLKNTDVIGMHYYTYLLRYNKVKENLNLNCTPHSGRHTFATLAEENGLNEFLIKKIMGHSSKDLTKDVYTHVEAKRLIDEVNKLPILK